MLLNSIIFFIFSFFLKWLLIRNSNTDFDTFGHLYYIKELRNQGTGPWSKIKIQCWEGKLYSHPFLLHSILSLLPFDFLLKNQKFVNILIDSLFCVYIYITAEFLFKNQNTAMLCYMLYLFMPIWFTKISMGPRVNNFTPRLFTEVIFNILACILVGVYNLDEIGFYFFGIILSSIIILTSKFGLQMILFSLPLISLFLQSLYPLILLFSSLLFTIIISNGSVINLFKSQIIHLIDYFKKNLKRNTSISSRNQFITLKKSELFSVDGIRKLVYNYLFYNSHTGIFFKMPILVVLVIISLWYYHLLEGVYFKMFLIIAAVCIVYLIVSIRIFLFLGEAERYLNHIAVLIIFCTVKLLLASDLLWILYAIIIYGFIFYLVELFFYNKFLKNTNKEDADIEVEMELNKISSVKVILSSPYHNFNIFRIMLNTKHKVIYPIHMCDSVRENFVSKYDKKYTFLDLTKLDEILEITNSSVIILYQPDSFDKELVKTKLTSEWYEIKLNNTIYSLYLKNDNTLFCQQIL